MSQPIQEKIKEAVLETAREIIPAESKAASMLCEFTLSEQHGDLSTNFAFKSSALLKQSPKKTAEDICARLSAKISREFSGLLKEVKVEGAGFINFYLSESYFQSQLLEILRQSADYGRSLEGKGCKTLIEFVSANPTGPLSVAHARQAAVGDALGNILSFLGFAVNKEYYLNDEGNQINILGKSVALRLAELAGQKIEFPENYYQGDYIYDIAKQAKQEGKENTDLSEYAAGNILAIIRQELDDFGVKFDNWYSQKSLRLSGKIDDAFKVLEKNGYLYSQDGAMWFKSTPLGDDKDRVVVKSDGSLTYLAPDIAYHRDKYARGFSWQINLWGPDHHGYINRLKASVAALGYDPQTLSVIIVQLASIFKDGKPLEMSTRKGQYITLREVLDEVGRDAARFFFMMRRTNSHLAFDLETAKKQSAENPVFYVQYARARISGILRQQPEPKASELSAGDLAVLNHEQEIELIRKLWQFPYILNICYKTLDPYMLTVYLHQVAESFHRFYDNHRVLGQEEKVTTARLALISAARTILSTGLDLLGVSKPDKM